MTSRPTWYDAAGTVVLLTTSHHCTWLTRGRLFAVSMMSLLSTILMFARQPPEVTDPMKSTAGNRLLLTLHCCAVAAARTSPGEDGVVRLNWYPSFTGDQLTPLDDRRNGNEIPQVVRQDEISTAATAAAATAAKGSLEVAIGNGTLVRISHQSRSASFPYSTERRRPDCRRRRFRDVAFDRKHLLNRTKVGRERYPADCHNVSAVTPVERLVELETVNSTRRLPQCLIIGVRKGGTRALLEFLSLHPGVNAEKQEVHFFDDDWRYSHGFNWYRQQMRPSRSEQITIEKTPAYFVSPRVPSRVRRMNESIKLLVIVRDPVERAISDYMQIHASRVARGKFHANFEQLVLDRRTGAVDRTYRAIWRSLYDRHMARWLHHFRLEQFHLVDGDKLVRDPVDELRKVERFLGLEHALGADKFYLNATRGFYCMRPVQLGDQNGVHTMSSGRDDLVDVDQVEGANQRELAGKCLSSSKGRPHPEIDPRVVSKLRQFFRQHNERFYQMVGVDFGWPV